MKIMVTGSEGTLGRKLVTELEQRGHDVWGCDLMHSSREQYARADIGNQRQVQDAFMKANPQIVYHLAAEFGRKNGEDYYEQLWTANCIGTRNVIDMCLSFNAHMVFASSSEAYGSLADDVKPVHESALRFFMPRFNNEYALSKFTNEKQIQIAVQHDGLKATTLRLFNAYGPGEHYSPYRSVVCLFVYRLLKGMPITVYSNYHRVFLWVGDWANTVANVADKVKLGHITNGNVYNVGGTEYCSVETLKDKILALIGGSKSFITMLDKEKANITNKRPDVQAAIHQLGHNPKTTLDEGLPLTIQWMRDTYNL